MEEDNFSLRILELKPSIKIENGRRQLQSVKPELQLQLNLTSWYSRRILPIAKKSQKSKKIQEVETQAQTV
jgi:hypothetical protein